MFGLRLSMRSSACAAFATCERAPLVMCGKDQETESEEEKQCKEVDQTTYQAQLAEAMALSAADDYVVPPLAPPPPTKPEPGHPLGETYLWDGVVHEWVSVPPI
ncbi:hypothetical protein D1007_03807 [Hordeum vulgare]|nr:hypothetical protein D1007_03807 [Hordeum vulgare]